ncbi:MAG: cryptochrome DASH, partial [Bacteroidetes bacterium]
SKSDGTHDQYQTCFSPWLAQGCLSPKTIFQELKKVEAERGADKSTRELFHDLVYRDFLRFMGKKYGNKIFQPGGILNQPPDPGSADKEAFNAWISGQTGCPIVDASMRELNETGFPGNRNRQIAASFLIHDLGVNWTWGAQYFESCLIDYDPCSNWVNWGLIAGVADDHTGDHKLNVAAQSRKLDPNGDYIRQWLPELRHLSDDQIHEPYLPPQKKAGGLSALNF